MSRSRPAFSFHFPDLHLEKLEMGVLLGFAPFIAFAVLANLSISLAVWIGLSVAFVITIRDFAKSPSVRLLDAVNFAMFALLAIYIGFLQPGLSTSAVRFIADVVLMITGIASLLRKDPFTIPYAREQVAEEFWASELFLRTNVRLSAGWSVALTVMAVSDALATFNHHFPGPIAFAISLTTLGAAIAFTARYPSFARDHAARTSRPKPARSS